ncbi:metallophosphoesterase family protein [Clostridium fallax]|uniref:Phosphoesterase n=1 Tax=Clostridium fallax TaxID=1533 RepID=A0A1M4TC60_9CLOT|nr:YfcE family phosphodiesterase [Clostridium fallax]SHE42129.1 phosphoesterase, MJ0936 family [Clostridium fallax]SQB22699.1 Ser/Thr protein phosphatase [Clostridium fallax]
MKIAVISDIHGNIYALTKVLEDIDNQQVDTIICLGDLVGYGPHPNEVIAMIRRRNIICLKGNYDASVVDNGFTFIRDTTINSFSLPWTVEELRASNRYYLASLPENITLKFEDKTITFVHGSPRAINEYMLENKSDLDEIMNNFKGDILVCAHTHIPYTKNFGNKILINDGSVGKPKIGRPNSTYVIIDLNKDTNTKIEIKELSYDFHKTIKDMEMKNFPSSLINSYRTGLE